MDPRIEEAIRAVPREHFLPAAQRAHAHLDQPLVLLAGQTCSQPTTVRRMLNLLDVHPGHRVLDVGSGSGWTTALLAHLVGPTGRVHGVEIVPELALWGRANVEAAGMTWATTHASIRGVLGYPDAGPFDRILVSAEARVIPNQLTEQLAGQGRLVIPVRGRLTVVQRDGPELRITLAPGTYRFVPLIDPGHAARHRGA